MKYKDNIKFYFERKNTLSENPWKEKKMIINEKFLHKNASLIKQFKKQNGVHTLISIFISHVRH